jgi:hypothetical protein
MGRNMVMIIDDQAGAELASFKLGYGTKLLVAEGDEVTRGETVRMGSVHPADHRREGRRGAASSISRPGFRCARKPTRRPA